MKRNILIIAIYLFLTTGCEQTLHNTNPIDYNTTQDIKEASGIINTNSTEISESAVKIEKDAKEIRTEANEASLKIPTESKKTIQPHMDKIKENSDSIIKESANIQYSTIKLTSAKELLEDSKVKISQMEDDIKKIENERNEALKERDKAIEEKNSQLNKLLRYLIVGSLALTGLFAALFFFTGSKIGLVGSAGCSMVMAVAIFVEAYLKYLVLVGGGIMLILIFILIISILRQRKAFFEVVDTVEVTQENLDPKVRDALFGGPGETGIMDAIQSQETMKLVKEAKRKMPKLWYYAKTKR